MELNVCHNQGHNQNEVFDEMERCFDDQCYLLIEEAILLTALIAWPCCVRKCLCTLKVVANHKEE